MNVTANLVSEKGDPFHVYEFSDLMSGQVWGRAKLGQDMSYWWPILPDGTEADIKFALITEAAAYLKGRVDALQH